VAFIIERLQTYHTLSHHDISIDKAMRAVTESRPGLTIEGTGLRARLVRSFLVQRAFVGDLDAKILQQCAMAHRKELGNRLAVIAVLAAVAPLLGLLGTVLGMIETFEVISLHGTGNAKAMAGGISVALVTTQTGLLVAIPGLFLSGMLSRQANRLRTRLDEFTTMLERLLKRPALHEGGAR